ncbi:MAG: hypothetical protein ACKV2V_04845 [Blastocatellia bacterium]
MFGITKHVGATSLLIIVITFVLFALALVSVGFTHDLLLEAGVFLISVKLILGSYRDSVLAGEIKTKLEALDSAVQRIADQMPAYRKSHDSDESGIVQAQRAIARSL